ncbi:hypothetical protein PC9H_007035 [Pleurotus ostreatus]|uniref:Uncharacterized protein n=1 Tax=Pleurotus ostreatus TaxID=5322 RepID=A0A8H7DRB7_PLEOS|nr:uncharacterized protein PC9H_007035 [Pleurotus ostreatus]KAF7427819.1 hypothetical protein PC9H_007035 [Pleurotus ostreatus]
MPDRRGSLRVVRAGTSVKISTYVTGWTFSLDLGEVSESSMVLHAELKLSLYSSARSGLRPGPTYYGMFLLRIDNYCRAPGGSHVSNVFLTGANLPAYTVTNQRSYIRPHVRPGLRLVRTPKQFQLSQRRSEDPKLIGAAPHQQESVAAARKSSWSTSPISPTV